MGRRTALRFGKIFTASVEHGALRFDRPVYNTIHRGRVVGFA
jgi:hypothetical protein